MTAFYDQNDLEEDLSRVGCGDVDLDFEYLFEYEQPAGDSRGLSDASLSLCGDVSLLPRLPKPNLITHLNQEVISHVLDV